MNDITVDPWGTTDMNENNPPLIPKVDPQGFPTALFLWALKLSRFVGRRLSVSTLIPGGPTVNVDTRLTIDLIV